MGTFLRHPICVHGIFHDPADVPDSPALPGLISDLIFTFTPDYARHSPALSGVF